MMRFAGILSGLVVMFGLIVPAHGAEHPDKLYETGMYEEAQAGYEQLGLDNPRDVRYRYNRGCAAYRNQDYQSALAAFSSVYRRADSDEMRFKAAFNLGNSAYQAGDLNSAVGYYRQAVVLNPENEDARYNLEFAVRELDKRNNEQQQGQDQQDSESQEGQSESQNGSERDQKDPGENEQQQQNQTGNQDQQQHTNQSDRQDTGSEQTRDLAGDLESAHPRTGDTVKEEEQVMPAEILDKKKAEALLDNVREDRSKFLRMRVPEDKRHGVASGKYW